MAVDWGAYDTQYGQARVGGGRPLMAGSADKAGWNPNASLISNLGRYARDPEFNIRGGDLSLASQVYNSFLGGISAGIIQSEHISDKDYGVIGDVAKTLTTIVGLGLALEGAGPLFSGLAKLGVRVPHYLRAPLTGMIYGGVSPTGKEFGSAADIEARLKAGGETAAIFSMFPASERLIAGGMKLKPGISARTAMAEDFVFKPGLLGGTAPTRGKQAIASGVTFGGYGAGEAVRSGEDPFRGGIGGGLAGLILGGKRKVPLFTPPESRIVKERKAKSRFAELGDVIGEGAAPIAPDVFLDSFTKMQQANIKKAGLSAEQIANLSDGQLAKTAGIGEKTRVKARELTNWEESEAGIQARAVETDLAAKGVISKKTPVGAPIKQRKVKSVKKMTDLLITTGKGGRIDRNPVEVFEENFGTWDKPNERTRALESTVDMYHEWSERQRESQAIEKLPRSEYDVVIQYVERGEEQGIKRLAEIIKRQHKLGSIEEAKEVAGAIGQEIASVKGKDKDTLRRRYAQRYSEPDKTYLARYPDPELRDFLDASYLRKMQQKKMSQKLPGIAFTTIEKLRRMSGIAERMAEARRQGDEVGLHNLRYEAAIELGIITIPLRYRPPTVKGAAPEGVGTPAEAPAPEKSKRELAMEGKVRDMLQTLDSTLVDTGARTGERIVVAGASKVAGKMQVRYRYRGEQKVRTIPLEQAVKRFATETSTRGKEARAGFKEGVPRGTQELYEELADGEPTGRVYALVKTQEAGGGRGKRYFLKWGARTKENEGWFTQEQLDKDFRPVDREAVAAKSEKGKVSVAAKKEGLKTEAEIVAEGMKGESALDREIEALFADEGVTVTTPEARLAKIKAAAKKQVEAEVEAKKSPAYRTEPVKPQGMKATEAERLAFLEEQVGLTKKQAVRGKHVQEQIAKLRKTVLNPRVKPKNLKEYKVKLREFETELKDIYGDDALRAGVVLGEQTVTDRLGLKKTEPKPKKRRTQMRSKLKTRKTAGKGRAKGVEPEAPTEIAAEPEPVVEKEPIKEVAVEKERVAEKEEPKKATSLFKGKKIPEELHIEDPDRRGKLIRYVEKAEHSTEDFVRLVDDLGIDILDVKAKQELAKQVDLLFKSRDNLNALKKIHGQTGAVIVKGKGKSNFKEGETVKVIRSTGEAVIGTATGKVTSGGFEKVRLRGDKFAKAYDPKKVEVAGEFERDITPDKEPEIKEVKDKKKPKKEKVTRVTADSVVVELTDKARASGEYGKAKQEILNELESVEEISAEGMKKVTEYAAEAGEGEAIAELNYLGRLLANFQPVVHVMGKIGDKKGVSQYAKVYNPMKEGYEASLREQASIMDASRDWVFRQILPKSGRETKKAAESFDAIQIIMDGATEAEFSKEFGRKPTSAERESVGRLRTLYDALHDYYGIEGWKEYYTPIRVNARKMYNVVVVEKKGQNLNKQEQKWHDDYQARGAVYASAEITGAPRESVDFFAELSDRGILNPVLDNALTTLTGYVRAGSASKWLDPQIQRIKAEYGARKGEDLHHIFETTGEKGIKWSGDKLSRNTAKVVNDYLMHMMGMRSQLEQGMNKKMNSMFKRINSIAPGKGELVPGHTDAAYASRFFTDMIYLGGMGGRIGSALKNITQQTHTAGEIGTRWLAKGYKDFATERGLKLIRDANIYHEFGPNMQREINIATNRRGQLMDIGLKLFQSADKINRATAYLGAHAKMLKYKDKINLTFVRKAQRGFIEKFMKEGSWEDAAVAYGKYVVQETQFLYTRADGAPIFRNPVGKMFGQFMTWPMWATSKYVQWGGALARNPKQLLSSPLMRYLVASALLLEGADKIAGVDIVPWIGFGILPTDIGGPIYQTFKDAGGAMVSGTQLAQAKVFESERMEKFAKLKFKRHIRGLEREAKLYPFSYAVRDIGRFIEAGDIRDLLGLPKSEGR